MNHQICIIIIYYFLITTISAAANRTWSTSSSNSFLGEEVELKKGPYKVLRVYPKNASHLNYLVKLWKSASKYQVKSGASDNPCEEIYHGTHAFSEPESEAVQKFITWYKNDIEAVITMHTYSQLWIHPYGHQRSVYPEDVNDLLSTAQKAAQALRSLYGTEYKVGSDPAAGGSDDWAKSKAGIKYVYLLELRPQEEVYDGFILETNQLIPTARETWEGVKVVTDAVMEKNGYALIPSSDASIDAKLATTANAGVDKKFQNNDIFEYSATVLKYELQCPLHYLRSFQLAIVLLIVDYILSVT
uniref:Peptidase M14 carboxypeptidase A domain-containing protein n=1 Tax=Romanomermis culicivorax TaxID=13658 RepID=A0A915K6C6_ROMCU